MALPGRLLRAAAVATSRIIDLVENEKLVTDWPDWRGDESVPRQTLTWTLEKLGPARTRVTGVHSGFVRAVDVSDYPFGRGYFLNQLKAVVEGREATPSPDGGGA